MANKLIPLVDAFRNRASQSGDFVLATIIETQGSTYQKAGARMLISKDGEWHGLLGGGCFEGDLLERARSVFAGARASTVLYDMRSPDDLVWGLGLGCNGAVRILLQLLKAEEHFYPLDALAAAVENDRRGVLITVVESEHPRFPAGRSLLCGKDDFKQALASWPAELIAAARRVLSAGKPHCDAHRVDGHRVSVFYDPIRPLPRLLIVGAGIDAIPLGHCAKALGWRVTIVDHRPAHIQPERFPWAERLAYCPPQNLRDMLPLDRFDALVMMTHSFEYDARYLKIIADSRIPFIGLLGPEARKNRLLESLGDQASRITERVFGPVGLDIGAETPEEIALSIMAGILAAQNRRRGGQLSLPKAFADAC
ncbi:MAG: XdhC family protein [Gammaproteobacteria bacterium]